MNTGGGGERDSLAPVIPLFGGSDDRTEDSVHPGAPAREPAWNATWADDLDDDRPPGGDTRRMRAGADETHPESAGDLAEKSLLRKLRTRSLSVVEARAVLIEAGCDPDTTAELLEVFLERGYLDDASLAEQIVHVAVDRKGQGRRAIAQVLAKRGIPRDVADAALASLPDDDADRALEYARSKARAMRDLDRDAALRRLSGQLARRGYGGSVAFDAARQALDELGSTSRVRFR